MKQFKEQSLAMVILSWKKPEHLDKTLQSYHDNGLFDLFDESLIFFQQISDDDRWVAKKYRLPCTGTEHNVGIAQGFALALAAVQSEYIVFLEEDCVLIEENPFVNEEISYAKQCLMKGLAHVCRLRHRWVPGDQFTTVDKFKKYHFLPGEPFNFKKVIRRYLRPHKYQKLIGTSVYVHDYPHYFYPNYIRKLAEGRYLVSSQVMNWTNQSIMFKKKWALETILPYVKEHPSRRVVNGFQDIEKNLNCAWWRKQDFKIYAGPGLFTHASA